MAKSDPTVPFVKERFTYVQKKLNHLSSVSKVVVKCEEAESEMPTKQCITETDIKNAKHRGVIPLSRLELICKVLDVHPAYITGEHMETAKPEFMGGLLELSKEQWLSNHPNVREDTYMSFRHAYRVDDERVFIMPYSVYEYEKLGSTRKNNIEAFRQWLITIPDYENIFLFDGEPIKEAWEKKFVGLSDTELKNMQYFAIKAILKYLGIEKGE